MRILMCEGAIAAVGRSVGVGCFCCCFSVPYLALRYGQVQHNRQAALLSQPVGRVVHASRSRLMRDKRGAWGHAVDPLANERHVAARENVKWSPKDAPLLLRVAYVTRTGGRFNIPAFQDELRRGVAEDVMPKFLSKRYSTD